MGAIFEMEHPVIPAEIDAFGHVNNQVYLAWMNEASIAHSAARGWPWSRHLKLGEGWVARRHEIEYLLPAKLGDVAVLRTWISETSRVTALRRYEMLRKSDGKMLARGKTLWAWINYSTGRPVRIAPEIAADFGIPPDTPAPDKIM
jgi:acyl-CoA thioester hydrolase